MFFAKGTLLVPSGTEFNPSKMHLHVVCNDTDQDGNNLLVPIATWTNDLCDGTCVLLKHEHDWLTKPKSYVMYRKAELFPADRLVRGLEQKKITQKTDCNAQVFLRIKNGVCNSPHTPRKIKHYFQCYTS